MESGTHRLERSLMISSQICFSVLLKKSIRAMSTLDVNDGQTESLDKRRNQHAQQLI